MWSQSAVRIGLRLGLRRRHGQPSSLPSPLRSTRSLRFPSPYLPPSAPSRFTSHLASAASRVRHNNIRIASRYRYGYQPNFGPFSGPQFQRRTVFSLPRAVLSLLRLPLALGAAGAGAMTYASYKMQEFEDKYVPDWMKDAYNKTTDYVKSIDLKNINIELPEFNIDFSKFRIPGELSSEQEPPRPKSPSNLRDQSRDNVTARPQSPSSSSTDMDFNNILKSERSGNVAGGGVAGGSGNRSNGMPPPEEDLMVLTKKLIEVRNLLKTVDTSTTNLKLPSIVVIGSQSSGKSSVLEAIVGHEFLPKGSNMVTRRPIELTLIHTPNTREEYGEFPQLGLGKVHDFKQVQKTLTDLNLAVSDSECVSSQPIELRVYSPNVPDLTLIDLPGYIALHNRHQPAILKEKIAELCESYIREPNIILAVCAADVDLANSEALRASRKVDPMGVRTIGVITKMDLVEPDNGVKVLKNNDYPLNLGYVGVVCKSSAAKNSSTALIRAEDAYFNSHSEFRQNGVAVGTSTLRRRLMQVLEDHMGRSLYSIVDAVQSELDDARYQFKVHYNDRRISAESYVAESMDSLKQRFKEFARNFGKPEVREQVRAMLEQRIEQICSDLYWSDPRSVATMAKTCGAGASDEQGWSNRLTLASSALTKSGIGRGSVQLVVDILMRQMENLTTQEPFVHHEDAQRKVMEFSNEILRNKFHTTVDQVENTIKPYKYEVECTEQEWAEGVKRAVTMMDRQLAEATKELQAIKGSLGRRKLRNAIKHLQKMERDRQALEMAGKRSPLIAPHHHVATEPASTSASQTDASAKSLVPHSASEPESPTSSPFNAKVLDRAKEAVRLQQKILTLQTRSAALRSRQCSAPTAHTLNKQCCPEAFLSVVSEKLTYAAVMFIHIELLNEFYFSLPREIDNRLYYDLGKDQIAKFARENEGVRKHLEVQERKQTLEIVMEKLRDLTRGSGGSATTGMGGGIFGSGRKK
ncbi:dynamin-like GTPase mgm1 [Quaeritorhiza haematococci]|nr:dynamin-like GTPase mgm1 [Quaeritorhiza haematococci]